MVLQHIIQVGLMWVRGEFANEIIKLLLCHLLQLLLVVLRVIQEVRDLVTLGLLDGNLLGLLDVTFQASFSPAVRSVAWVLPLADLAGAKTVPEARTAAVIFSADVSPLIAPRAALLAVHFLRRSANSAYVFSPTVPYSCR